MVAASRKLPTTWLAAREAGHSSVGSRTEMVMPIFTCIARHIRTFTFLPSSGPHSFQAIWYMQAS